MFLNNPATYLSVAEFKARALDYDISGYSDAQLQTFLVEASGHAESIMRRKLRAQERTIRYLGDGTNRLELHQAPLLYVKRLQIVFPGTTGPYIPMDQLLLDHGSGSVFEYTPMLFNGTMGYFSRFPDGIPVDVTLAWGFAYTYAQPAYTTLDSANRGGVTPGAYNLAITTKSMWGETTAVVKQYTTASGVFVNTITPVLGAYLYRAYCSSAANNTTLNGATLANAATFTVHAIGGIAVGDVLLIGAGATAEYATVAAVNGSVITPQAALVNAHADGEAVIEQPKLVAESPFTAYGSAAMNVTVNSLSAPDGIYQDVLPLTDNSAPPIPDAIPKAVAMLTLDQMYEQNNLANRGVSTTRSGRKEVQWRATDGNSAKGVSSFVQQATELLKPYSLQKIF